MDAPPPNKTFEFEEKYDSFPYLTDEEAARRLVDDGYNELPSATHKNFLTLITNILLEPMFLLLITCGTLYLILGDREEAFLLFGSIIVIIAIDYFQEQKTERALEALRGLSNSQAITVRNGVLRRIPGRDVVRGDVVLLTEGDRVPADGVILASTNLMVNESLLTGESIPVQKTVWQRELGARKPGGDNTPFIFSGTLVTRGRGVAKIEATGLRTEIGRIGKSLGTIVSEKTPLQLEIGSAVKKFAAWGIFLCLLVVAANGIINEDWTRGFLSGLALAMSLLPEELPVVLTVFLALGAWRLSQREVLARRVPVLETLGAITALCVDKTGTLTENRMSINTLAANGEIFQNNAARELPETFHELVEFALLGSQKGSFDPMERAILDFGARLLGGTEHIHTSWTLIRQYPLSDNLLALSQVWKSPDEKNFVIAAKGAPESIFDLCHLALKKRRNLTEETERLAAQGLRVLGVARARFAAGALPTDQHKLHFEFLGLLGFADPIRPNVSRAIEVCRRAGIRPIMITGDYPSTARNIASQIHLKNPVVISGDELDRLSDDELTDRARQTNIYARVIPEQKLRIVEALKKNGEIVAMTGDGVNDAPALKAAHVGIALGKHGTDVAREAASLIVLNDDFNSIVQAIKNGRRIYANIKKAATFIVATHIPIAGLALIPVLLRWPLFLLPIHIVFLELIIDPACSIVFEAEPIEKNAMEKPPRKISERLLSLETIAISTLQGSAVLLLTLFLYRYSTNAASTEEARAITFIALVLSFLFLILTIRSWETSFLRSFRNRNAALWYLVAGILSLLALVIVLPAAQRVFYFKLPSLSNLILALGAVALGVIWFETLKLLKKSYDRSARRPS